MDRVFTWFQWMQSEARRELRRASLVARLDLATMRSVARSPSATPLALGFIGISTVCGALGSLFFPVDYKGVLYQPRFFEALMHAGLSWGFILLALWLIHTLARRLFAATGTWESFLRVAGYGYISGFFNLFPTLTLLVLGWVLVVTGKTLMVVHRLTLQQAVSTLLVAFGVVVGLFFLMLGVNPSMLYGGFYLVSY